MDDWFPSALKLTTRAIEVGGIAIIVLGLLGSSVAVLWQVLHGRPGSEAFNLYRSNVGRAILLGLEFLVAADIINTVAVDPTFRSVGVLAGIVAIRTFLSFSLEVEIEGRWPWDRHKGDGDSASRRTA
ncbi:MAG: DUF1622 domain-containing protein [Microvirga sp.]